MNVYDFDKTIYHGDSSVDFYFYCLWTRPKIMIYFPVILLSIGLFLIGIYNKTKLKEKFYSYLVLFDDIDTVIDNFWKDNNNNIKQWYLEKRESSDLIISASPEFLLKPICKKLNINLIASKVDKNNGKYEGENCYGEEKVKRFFDKYTGPIEKFYSDSLSDAPLAEIAVDSFIVREDNIIKWEYYKPTLLENIKNNLLAKVFFL